MKISAILLVILFIAVCCKAAFVHPGVGFTIENLEDFKANLEKYPWKDGYDYLKGSYYANMGYMPQGPVEVVSRTNDINLYPYRRDSQAIFELSLHGYISNNTDLLEKAKNLAYSWTVVHKTFAGSEIYLETGDNVPWVFGGFEILRMVYGSNITFVEQLKNYSRELYSTIYSGGGIPISVENESANLRGCNQGAAQISQQLYVAVFTDDEIKFQQVLDAFLTHDGCGLGNILPNGQLGDYGRDKGHAVGQLVHVSRIASIFWSQGVDVFSLEDNKFLNAVEYWIDYFFFDKPRPYIHHGCQYEIYGSIGGGATRGDPTSIAAAYSAYKTRLNVPTPSIDAIFPNITTWDAKAIVFLHSSDNSTARRPARWWKEAEATKPFTLAEGTNRGINGGWGNASYIDGVWKVRGSGYGPGKSNNYVFMPIDNDFTMKARVVSVTDEDGYNVTDGYGGGLSVRTWVDYNSQFLTGEIHPAYFSYDTRGGWTWHGSKATRYLPRPPYWLKITRRSHYLSGYTSPDGIHWTLFSKSFYGAAVQNTTYIGLTVLSGSLDRWATVTFDNVFYGNGTYDNFGAITLEDYPSTSTSASGSGSGSASESTTQTTSNVAALASQAQQSIPAHIGFLLALILVFLF